MIETNQDLINRLQLNSQLSSWIRNSITLISLACVLFNFTSNMQFISLFVLFMSFYTSIYVYIIIYSNFNKIKNKNDLILVSVYNTLLICIIVCILYIFVSRYNNIYNIKIT